MKTKIEDIVLMKLGPEPKYIKKIINESPVMTAMFRLMVEQERELIYMRKN